MAFLSEWWLHFELGLPENRNIPQYNPHRNIPQHTAIYRNTPQHTATHCCVAVCCGILRCVAVCCGMGYIAEC
jgi:hypothetical protein